MLVPAATKALSVNLPIPEVPPTTTAPRGAVASLMSALEALISVKETIVASESFGSLSIKDVGVAGQNQEIDKKTVRWSCEKAAQADKSRRLTACCARASGQLAPMAHSSRKQ